MPFTDTFDQINVSFLNKSIDFFQEKKNHNAPQILNHKNAVEASHMVIKYIVRYMCILAAAILVSCQPSQHFKSLYL